MPAEDHRKRVIESVPCGVVTVSDTRTRGTDESGLLIKEGLVASGHGVYRYEIIPDEPRRVQDLVLSLCHDSECQAVMLTGGTGLASRDVTYEAIDELLEKRIDGFGELFRMLSYDEIGSAAILSRAVAGVRESTAVFSMPGSRNAVRLAMDKLILPELGHIAFLLNG